jgi:peptidoglycan/xylan/chitin deacetylase (PgdA/CDA1 family)
MRIPGTGFIRRTARRWIPGSVILMYHRVARLGTDPWSLCVDPTHFEEHLQVLREFGRALPLARLTDPDTLQRVSAGVALTFDDGYSDNLHTANPLLERYDVPATVFVATGGLDDSREFWWDELDRILLQPGQLPACLEMRIPGVRHTWDLGPAAHLSDSDFERGRHWRADNEHTPTRRHALYAELYRLLHGLEYHTREQVLAALRTWAGVGAGGRATHRRMSAEEVAALAAGGLVEIGAHTVTHPDLSHLPLSLQTKEIEESKCKLEGLVARPVTSFAYPHGGYTQATVSAVRVAGYSRACCSRVARVRKRADPFLLPRICVPDCGGEAFAALLRRYLPQIRNRVQIGI